MVWVSKREEWAIIKMLLHAEMIVRQDATAFRLPTYKSEGKTVK